MKQYVEIYSPTRGGEKIRIILDSEITYDALHCCYEVRIPQQSYSIDALMATNGFSKQKRF